MHKHAKQWLLILGIVTDEVAKHPKGHEDLTRRIPPLIGLCKKYQDEFDFPGPSFTDPKDSHIWVEVVMGLIKDEPDARKTFSLELQPLIGFFHKKQMLNKSRGLWNRAFAGNGFDTPSPDGSEPKLVGIVEMKKRQLEAFHEKLETVVAGLDKSTDVYSLSSANLMELFDVFILCNGVNATALQHDSYNNLLQDMYDDGVLGTYLSIALMQIEHNPMARYSPEQREALRQDEVFVKMYNVDTMLVHLKDGSISNSDYKSLESFCKNTLAVKVMTQEFGFIKKKLAEHDPKIAAKPKGDSGSAKSPGCVLM